jgi:omega-6 fatty acid desaturase (delta-12 desaturase)
MASTLRQRTAAAPAPSASKKQQEHDVLASSDSEGEEGQKESSNPLKAHENDYPAFEIPNFTIKEILGAIPAHCFERSALRSSLNVVLDFTWITLLGYAATYIDPAFGTNGNVLNGNVGWAAKWTMWNLYWLVAGCVTCLPSSC